VDASSDEVEPRSTRSAVSPVLAFRSPKLLTMILVNACSLSLDYPRTTKRLSSSSTTNSNPRRKGGFNPFKRRRVTRSKPSAYLFREVLPPSRNGIEESLIWIIHFPSSTAPRLSIPSSLSSSPLFSSSITSRYLSVSLLSPRKLENSYSHNAPSSLHPTLNPSTNVISPNTLHPLLCLSSSSKK